MERARVTGDRDALMLKDQELFNVQREAEMATRKAKFYKDTLADLAMFKSKTDVALLQAQVCVGWDGGGGLWGWGGMGCGGVVRTRCV